MHIRRNGVLKTAQLYLGQENAYTICHDAVCGTYNPTNIKRHAVSLSV